MAQGRLFYGSETFEVDDSGKVNAAVAAALDSNATFVDVVTSEGSLRVFLSSGASVAVLTLGEPSTF